MQRLKQDCYWRLKQKASGEKGSMLQQEKRAIGVEQTVGRDVLGGI
jgi:hypothetical protein